MALQTEWTGTASELLSDLRRYTRPGLGRVCRGHSLEDWTEPRPSLRKVGIVISKSKEGHDRTRMIHIMYALEEVRTRPSASSADLPNPNGSERLASEETRTIGNGADGRADGAATNAGSTVRTNVSNSQKKDDAGGADAKNPRLNGDGRRSRSGLEGTAVSAAEALKNAHAVGVRVGTDGRDLLLEAAAPPAPAVLDELAHHSIPLRITGRATSNSTSS